MSVALESAEHSKHHHHPGICWETWAASLFPIFSPCTNVRTPGMSGPIAQCTLKNTISRNKACKGELSASVLALGLHNDIPSAIFSCKFLYSMYSTHLDTDTNLSLPCGNRKAKKKRPTTQWLSVKEEMCCPYL